MPSCHSATIRWFYASAWFHMMIWGIIEFGLGHKRDMLLWTFYLFLSFRASNFCKNSLVTRIVVLIYDWAKLNNHDLEQHLHVGRGGQDQGTAQSVILSYYSFLCTLLWNKTYVSIRSGSRFVAASWSCKNIAHATNKSSEQTKAMLLRPLKLLLKVFKIQDYMPIEYKCNPRIWIFKV